MSCCGQDAMGAWVGLGAAPGADTFEWMAWWSSESYVGGSASSAQAAQNQLHAVTPAPLYGAVRWTRPDGTQKVSYTIGQLQSWIPAEWTSWAAWHIPGWLPYAGIGAAVLLFGGIWLFVRSGR